MKELVPLVSVQAKPQHSCPTLCNDSPVGGYVRAFGADENSSTRNMLEFGQTLSVTRTEHEYSLITFLLCGDSHDDSIFGSSECKNTTSTSQLHTEP